MKETKFNELALMSLIVGIMCFVQFLGIEKALCALVLGLFALNRITKTGEGARGKYLAIAGIVLGLAYIITLSTIIGMNPGIFTKVVESLNK